MKIGRNVLLLLLIVINTSIFAQRNFSADADKAYDLRQYSEAIELYGKAYAKVKGNKAEKARIIFKTAMCYKMMNDDKKAESWFSKAIKAKYEDSKVYLYYAEVLKTQGRYDEAIVNYQTYKQLVPSDAAVVDAAIEASRMANSWVENPTRYEIFNEKQLNTKENEFAPAYADKKFRSLYLTSDREGTEGKKNDGWTGLGFTDIFMATKDKNGKWSTPAPIGIPINTEYHDGGVSLNEKASTMYFTRCEFAKKEQMGCNIFFTNKKGKDWELPEVLTLSTDTNKAVVYAHPAISDDELTLYFVSDMEGGQGGKDIWKITRPKKNKPWGSPENLGSVINTAQDEMYPFIHVNGTLYFSSNGHMGLGGLDIYKAEPSGNGFGAPQNMKYPVNSSFDDFGIIFEGASVERGFLSSNRKAGRGGDDIYSFVLPPLLFTLKGVVTDDSTKKTVTKALVTLTGSDGSVLYDTTDVTGMYTFDNKAVKPNTSYTLTVKKDKHLTIDRSNAQITTVGKEHSEDMVQDLALIAIPKQPIVLPDILYDLAKWDLKPQYQDSLNGLYKTLKQNENIVIELSSHTDIRAELGYNDTLSLKRAQSVVDYLIKKGIDVDRIVPKGYGERIPRVLKENKVVIYNGKPYTFKKGTVLNEQYINSLKSEDEKEAAHQLNRRTEFKVLKDDYVPTTTKNKKVEPVKIEIITDEKQDKPKTETQPTIDNKKAPVKDTKSGDVPAKGTSNVSNSTSNIVKESSKTKTSVPAANNSNTKTNATGAPAPSKNATVKDAKTSISSTNSSSVKTNTTVVKEDKSKPVNNSIENSKKENVKNQTNTNSVETKKNK